MGRKAKPTLGRSIIKQRFGGKQDLKTNDGFLRHTADVADGYDWGRLNLQSVTDQSNLDDFLATAERAGAEFAAEKQNVTFVNPASITGGHGVLTADERTRMTQVQDQNRGLLSIPRRPVWSVSMTAEDLQLGERDAFLEWRRRLAELQEIEGIMLTPFEKNLEFWRQLWRVIERSDVVVQIVDARNPLLFRCEDLEKYVNEVDRSKMNMILVNKADFLTAKQRELWADYFEGVGLAAVFFSALLEVDVKVAQNEEVIEKKMSENEDFSQDPAGLQSDALPATADKKSKSPSSTGQKGKLCSRDELIAVFRNCHKNSNNGVDRTKRFTTIGLVGYPNVGKSSTINAIMTLKKVSVSATPGKTKHFQTLYVDDELMLCDCPGLVMPTFISTKAEMVVSGILPIDQMKDHVGPINLPINVASIIPRHVLESTYGIHLPTPRDGEDRARPPTSEELLNSHGYMRGFMTQRGLPDNPRAARYILKDYVNGKLLYCHAPPNVDQDVFHSFPAAKPKRICTQTPYQAKVMRFGKICTQDLDKEFFRKATIGVHIKKGSDVQGAVSSGYSQRASSSDAASVSSSFNEKPWKRHNNRGKKEKLRRMYADLDE